MRPHLLLNDWFCLLVLGPTWHLLVTLVNASFLSTFLALLSKLLLYAHDDVLLDGILLLDSTVFSIPAEVKLKCLVQVSEPLFINLKVLHNLFRISLQIDFQPSENFIEL